jgi:ferric-dicitrate binding protein FerR (iron transport regulator)
MGSMMQWLNLLAYSLPELFGLGIALALLATNARQGPARRLGLLGIGLMLVAAVLGMGLSVYQQLMIANANDAASALGRMFSIVGGIRVVLNLVSIGGLLAVVWGLCVATRTVANEER